MNEDDIWLSEEEEDEDDKYTGALVDPTFFSLSLTSQGQPGGLHVRNKPGERQRKAVSVFHGGAKKKPAFTVTCNAKAMIHGKMSLKSKKKATLLVYEFKFNSYRGTRIKEADILFEFHAKEGMPGGPSVTKVRPHGLHKMEGKTETNTSKLGAELSIGPQIPAVNAGLKLYGEDSVEKVTIHHTVITGDNPQSDDFGSYFQARFFLSENKSRKTGIPSELTVCILLERDDDEDFVCVPYIEATPNFSTVVASLFSSRTPDESIPFSVKEDPFDDLGGKVVIDRDNLGATDLDNLWDCTAYNEYGAAIKPSKPGKEVKGNDEKTES